MGPTEESDVLFYGADNQSAKMKFRSFVYVELGEGVPPEDIVDPVNADLLMEVINYQLQHMFGAFTEHPKFVDNPGIALNAKNTITNGVSSVQIDKKNVIGVQNNKYARVFYTYTDSVVFEKSMFANGPLQIEFRLPKDPMNVYTASSMPINRAIRIYEKLNETEDYSLELKDLRHIKKDGTKTANLCTNLHYNEVGDFWYFWNPEQPSCPLKKSDMVMVKAQLDPVESTKRTYPYYDALYGDNGNGNLFQVNYLVGIDENFRRGDLGRGTFNEATELLLEVGYERMVEEGGSRWLRRFHKEIDGVEYRVNMRLVNPDKDAFVPIAKEAIETADVFIYDGHSGLGGYLYVDRFEEVTGSPLVLPKDKHQIMYFNGCSTYSYYSTGYFEAKGGIEKLDVLSTSIGALFSVGARHDIKVIEHLTSGKRPTWQKIMDDIYKSAHPDETALTHVNGDEDNPRRKNNQ